MMKRVLLFFILLAGCLQGVVAQDSGLKKCSYNGPELSFSFLYPSDMEERPTVRPHIKASVISGKTDFGFAVSVLEFNSELEIRREWQSWVSKSEEELKQKMQQIANDQEYSAHNVKVLSVQKDYVIDRLPAILITQTLDLSVLDKSGKCVQWMFLLFYKNKMIELCGMMPIMSPASELLAGRSEFLKISASFAVTSQYLETDDCKKQALDTVWGVSLEYSQSELLQYVRKKGIQPHEYNGKTGIINVLFTNATFAGYANCWMSFAMNEDKGPICFVSVMFPRVDYMSETKPLTDFCKRMIENKYDAVYTRLADYEEAGITRPPKDLYPYIIGRYTFTNGDYIEIYIEDKDIQNNGKQGYWVCLEYRRPYIRSAYRQKQALQDF